MIPGEATEMNDMKFNMSITDFDSEKGFTLVFNFTNPLLVGVNTDPD